MKQIFSHNPDVQCPERLAALLKAGDERAFGSFVRTYQDMVFACCRSVGLSGADVEDAASEAFLAAFQSIGQFNGDGKLSSWLWTIAYRKAAGIRAKKKRSECMCEDLSKAVGAASEYGEADQLERREQCEVVWDAVGCLPEKWAAVVVLFYRQDKTIVEIAEMLQIPVNTVKTYLVRSRKKLYELLGSVWGNDYVQSRYG